MFATPVRRLEEEEPVIDLIEFGANYSVSFAAPPSSSLLETPIMVTPENHPMFAFRPMVALPIQRNLFDEVEEEAEEMVVPPSPDQSVVILSVTMKPRRLFENVIDLTGEEAME